MSVLRMGWSDPMSLRTCEATEVTSSFMSDCKLSSEVGKPTSFSASETARFQACGLGNWICWLVMLLLERKL